GPGDHDLRGCRAAAAAAPGRRQRPGARQLHRNLQRRGRARAAARWDGPGPASAPRSALRRTPRSCASAPSKMRSSRSVWRPIARHIRLLADAIAAMGHPSAAAVRTGDQAGTLIDVVVSWGIATRAHEAHAAGMSTGFTEHPTPPAPLISVTLRRDPGLLCWGSLEGRRPGPIILRDGRHAAIEFWASNGLAPSSG